MDVTGLLLQSFEDVHRELRAIPAEFPAGSLFWQPAPSMNHIGFLLWHLVRDEDTMMADLSGHSQVWAAGNWRNRPGLSALGDEASLVPSEAYAVRYELALFLEYAERVWEHTLELVPGFSGARLEVQTWPGWNLARSLVEGSIGHSWLHLGEIRYVMGLRGWRHSD